MKWMRTLKWLIAILMMQMKDRTSLMRNRKALSLLVFLGRSYPDKYQYQRQYLQYIDIDIENQYFIEQC